MIVLGLETVTGSLRKRGDSAIVGECGIQCSSGGRQRTDDEQETQSAWSSTAAPGAFLHHRIDPVRRRGLRFVGSPVAMNWPLPAFSRNRYLPALSLWSSNLPASAPLDSCPLAAPHHRYAEVAAEVVMGTIRTSPTDQPIIGTRASTASSPPVSIGPTTYRRERHSGIRSSSRRQQGRGPAGVCRWDRRPSGPGRGSFAGLRSRDSADDRLQLVQRLAHRGP